MVRNEESKRLWILAEAARDFDTMDKIEAEWTAQAEPEPHIDYPGDEQHVWSGEDDPWEGDQMDDWATEDLSNSIQWTDEDEAGLEEHEEAKRRRIAESNEY